ncbi:elongation factor P [Candidatus Roizmanbacteria bacterium RIFCSPHIGHO2_02_FULL_37_13b]|uniref:Elongation factor P n=1 Tax=Candidatus Roizmanbacteria bacterium RIFCSPLOWO2_02_FULL_36_11 TaxID=1802071 RepID=A0A1F7JGG0_9BACT|nr:MAG: elongation factor P [Candidatus Roizmanbacteria bacterium RIFCSPHIGHO2_02_FULL_37_13b]OGK54704.1 MAG: elongation factor P [Candidatus Roizmanbacteria bacterium RIFCSPLOWO2_02_FULL_36_11]
MKIDAGSLKKGDFIKQNDEILQVLKFEHNFRGRGSATCRLKTKNIKTGNSLDISFRTADMTDILDVETIKMQFLYKSGESYVFMDQITFEQQSILKGIVGSTGNYLKEGDIIHCLIYQGECLAIRPPQSVKLKVIQADDALKGDTATYAKKQVVLETGITILTPLFIKNGDIIAVNPETGEYVERVNK